MKAVSISLKVLAILAACFCVYAWVDTRKQVSTAEGHMKDVAGETLVDKASKVPEILNDKAKAENTNNAFRKTVANLESQLKTEKRGHEAERANNIRLNKDFADARKEISTLTESEKSLKGQLANKDSVINQYKKELAEKNELLSKTDETDALKEKIATLETQLKTKSDELAEANKKAKLMEMSEVVEVIETDANGNKVKKKVVKTPYVPKGDIATVISVDQANGLVGLNLGQKAGVKEDQKILLKRDGQLVSEIIINSSTDDLSIGSINRLVAIPETIEVGDLLELDVEQAVSAAPAAAAAEKKEGEAEASESEEPSSESDSSEDSTEA